MAGRFIRTPVGKLWAVWNEQGLLRSCAFSENQTVDPTGPFNRLCTARHKRLREAIEEYFAKGCLQWNLALLDWSCVPAFEECVLRQCCFIPVGETLTYGQLARQAGSPRAARAVGASMAKNRWPIIIPCHRVIGATGQLTGYSGTGGIATKQWLLELESSTRALSLGTGASEASFLSLKE